MRSTARVMDRKRVGVTLVFALVLAGLVSVGHATSAPPDVAISMKGFQFVTSNMTTDVTVPVGTKVIWTNNESFAVNHTATSDTAVFDTGSLGQGMSGFFIFNTAGVFPYHCIFHGTPGAGMHGTVTVVNPPAPTAVTPNFGGTSGGNNVTITGTNFLANATVMFGGVLATNVVVMDANTITATTPAHTAGTVDVVVTNPGGNAGTLSLGFTFAVVNPLPIQQPAGPALGAPNPLPVPQPVGPPLSAPNPLPNRQRLGSGSGGNGGAAVTEPTAAPVPAPNPLPTRR